MSPIEIAWTAVGVIVPMLVGIGFAVAGYSPPEFVRARVCFYLAAAILGGMEIVWYTQTGWSFTWRVATACLICMLVGIGLPETLRWLHGREITATPPTLNPPSTTIPAPMEPKPLPPDAKRSKPNPAQREKENEQTINTLTVEMRLVCVLRDPSKLPTDLVMYVPRDPTYLQSTVDQVILSSLGGVAYQRLDEEGKAYAVQVYKLPDNSYLIGLPQERLAEYKKMYFSMAGVNGKDFRTCLSSELTIKVNGRKVVHQTEKFNLDAPDSEKTAGADIILQWRNLKD